MKKKTAILRVGATKSKRKEIKAGTMQWKLKPKQRGNLTIKYQINRSIYNWIINHPKVLQSPIFNYCLKVSIDSHTRTQNFPKLLLHMYVRELHNSLVRDPVDNGLKDARDVENNIIISDSTLR